MVLLSRLSTLLLLPLYPLPLTDGHVHRIVGAVRRHCGHLPVGGGGGPAIAATVRLRQGEGDVYSHLTMHVTANLSLHTISRFIAGAAGKNNAKPSTCCRS